MKAFFTDDQLLHDPQQFMRLGRISKPMACAKQTRLPQHKIFASAGA
ncbi:MAG: hypothetical protein ACI9I0_001803 [Rhodoferax sp.]|jgi:hypothetical protein